MGGVFSRSTRAASVSLVTAPSSPTHSGSGGSSGPLSSDGSPKSPRSPVTLALPPSHSPEKYPGIHADQASLLSPEDLFSLEKLEDGDAEADPVANLSTCGLVRANVARRYEQFAMSKVGLVTRAFLMSLPQSLTTAAALIYSFSGLITPLVDARASSNHEEDYFLSLGVISLVSFVTILGSETYFRLKDSDYNSFSVFRLRATFMGAALGGTLAQEFLSYVVNLRDPWVNFGLTIPAVLVPTYLRFHYFKHDIIPAPLFSTQIINQFLEEKRGCFNNPIFNAAASFCKSTSVGLIGYRAVKVALLNEDFHPFTTTKVLCGAVPGVLGGAVSVFGKSLPELSRRWPQAEILAGDSAMSYLAIGTYFFCFNSMSVPEYWWSSITYLALTFSLLCSVVQASRVVQDDTKKSLMMVA